MRRVLAGLAIAVLGSAVLIGAEVVIALRREYLPTDDPLELDARFGPPGGDALSLVVLGDSTAAGIGAEHAGEAYPTMLAERLARATGRPVELRVLGVSGARAADVAHEQAPAAAALGPDVVVLAIGANDVTHLTSLAAVRAATARALGVLAPTGAPVVVAGAPDMRARAWLEPLRSLAYLRGKQVARAIEGVARAGGAAVVELAEQTGPLFARDPGRYFSADGFHPSGAGYGLWADALFPAVLDAVRRRG